jgi:DNA ligase-3
MAPDFIAKDPKASPVWEITGAEFSKAEMHTADGISIRFPRVTKIRDDKNWKTSTSLSELKALFEASKESTSFELDYEDDGGKSGDDREKSKDREVREKSKDKYNNKEKKEKEKVKSESKEKRKEESRDKENGSSAKDRERKTLHRQSR